MKRTLNNIFTSEDASFVKEKGFIILMDAGCEKKTVNEFLNFCKRTCSEIKYVILTHSHWDHVDNLKFYKKQFPNLKVIAHKNNPLAETKISTNKKIILGETEIILMPTPGHCEKKDDLCIYLPKEKVLFSGDMVQAQGFTYESCNFSTPLPYFEYGDDYIKSLQKLIKLDIDYVITGHGLIRYKNSIRITLKITQRIKDISKELTENNKNLTNSEKCDEVFRIIAKERKFKNINGRLSEDYYKELDKQGILYFLKKHHTKLK